MYRRGRQVLLAQESKSQKRNPTPAHIYRLLTIAKQQVPFLSRFYLFYDCNMRAIEAEKESMHQQDERVQLESAAHALYERYAASIFAYARLHTPSWEDAEDLTLALLRTVYE